MNVYFHADLDGLASAVILADYLSEQDHETCCFFPVRHDVLQGWERTELRRPAAILDFRFHPSAEYWFDHHQVAPAVLAALPKSVKLVHSTEFASCASLTYNYLAETHAHRNERLLPLVQASDRIDSGQVANPADVYRHPDSWQILDHIIQVTQVNSEHERIVVGLLRGESAATLITDERWALTLENLERKKAAYFAALKSAGRFLPQTRCLLHPPIDYAFHKYLPYAAFPEAVAACGIVYDASSYQVIVTTNPRLLWEGDLDVAELCRAHGGGGHPNRGGIPARSLAEAEGVLEQVASELRHLLRPQAKR